MMYALRMRSRPSGRKQRSSVRITPATIARMKSRCTHARWWTTTIQSRRGSEARLSLDRSSMAEAMLPVEVKPVFLPPSFSGRMNERTYARKTSICMLVAESNEMPSNVLTGRKELLQVRVVRRQTYIELLVDLAGNHCQEDLMNPSTEHVYRHESD